MDMSVPRSAEAVATILGAIDVALAQGRTVDVHCWGRIGRTEAAVGC